MSRDVHQEAQKITHDLEMHPNDKGIMAANKELQQDMREMTPQQYAQLLREIQNINSAHRSADKSYPELHLYSTRDSNKINAIGVTHLSFDQRIN